MRQLDKSKFSKDFQRGQAMSEFVILLMLIMGLCAGMIYVSRLQTLQYWTRQESRMLAFRYTWAARQGGIDPFISMAPRRFGKPKVVITSGYARYVNIDEDFRFDLARNTHSFQQEISNDTSTAFAFSKALKESLSFVNEAVAFNDYFSPSESWENELRKPGKMESAFKEILTETKFGERFCSAMRQTVDNYGSSASETFFATAECPKDYDQAFALQLSKEIRWRKFFNAYGRLIDHKRAPEGALQEAAEAEIKAQFNLLFDTKIKYQFRGLSSYGGSRARPFRHFSQPEEALDALTNAEFNNRELVEDATQAMLQEARYRGGREALETVAQYAEMVSNASLNPNIQQEYLRERQRDHILHEDLYESSNGSDFRIDFQYLPIPPDLTKAYSKLSDGLMYNVLTKDEGLQREQIETSDIIAVTRFPIDKSFFSYLYGRMATRDTQLQASFALVDQPWHISRQLGRIVGWRRWPRHWFFGGRRASPVYGYDYRELGGEYDSMDSDTEEGILRRRTYGLWFMPSRPGKLAEGIAAIGGLDLGVMSGALNSVDTVVSFGKDTLAAVLGDPGLAPFRTMGEVLNQLPELVRFNIVPPVLPVARPQVYPWSVEMQDDQLMGESRNLDDYASEQRQHFDNEP
ncbi:MAG: hypothetical protein IT292_04455 [Deltaproteobacteria bacterium]|nr:hypothetical protein [Deltaproteobacteria bacterium]